jgi:hypothetical protein
MGNAHTSSRPEKLDALRDSLDFRDLIYRPALVNLRQELLPEPGYMKILHQGREGACTGFGLGAVINFLIHKRAVAEGVNTDGASLETVSPRMLYEMAKHHDQWPGQDYGGSSARGALKGWYKNGVCSEPLWKYEVNNPGYLTHDRQLDALKYPLGAYYRVQRRRSDLHAALNEVGAVFATAATHNGWDQPENGVIQLPPAPEETGGHAFAIVGYTKDGFIIQNSWGEDWGGARVNGTFFPGCAIWTYPDFDLNLWDAWVARLALPVESIEALLANTSGYAERPGGGTQVVERAPLRPTIRAHFIHIDDGEFDRQGEYYSDEGEVNEVIKQAVANRPKHLLLYAHGGLNSVKGSACRVVKWRPVFAANGIHEIHFIWETGLLEETRDILLGKEEMVSQLAGGPSDWVDRWIEKVTQRPGHALWNEMLSDAAVAFQRERAGYKVVGMLAQALNAVQEPERPKLHLVGHSAGAVWLGHLLAQWQHLAGLPIENLILFAPACTHEFFRSHIGPAVGSAAVRNLHHFLLDKDVELNDNVAQVYRKSLLYLVSRSYQRKGEVVPIMGLAEHLGKLPVLGTGGRITDYRSPSNANANANATASTSHGGFDNDAKTMNSMLQLVLGTGNALTRGFTSNELSGY